MKIDIARPHAPATQLFVEVISDNPDKLGQDRPVAFILPGGPGMDHTGYQRYEALKEVADLVFHDPRGCGQSDKGDVSQYNMNNYIDDVEDIRKALSLNEITVVGKSYGSMCALGYAVRYPDHIKKLVLAAGAPSYRFLETAKKNILRLGTPEQIKICEKLWTGGFANKDELMEFFRLTNPLYSLKGQNPPDFAKKGTQFSFEVLNEGFKREFWHFDYENDLQKVICPTLILAGEKDWINDVSHAEFMVSRIPHSQIKVFENSSHAMEVDATDEYFQTIADFIAV